MQLYLTRIIELESLKIMHLELFHAKQGIQICQKMCEKVLCDIVHLYCEDSKKGVESFLKDV